MDKLFLAILNMSLTGAFVIAAICLARLPLKKAPKIISYCLWAVAGFRLVFPFSIESVFSLIPFKAQTIPFDIAMQPVPRIDSGVAIVDNIISGSLPAPALGASVNPLQIQTTIGAFIWLVGVAAMLIYGVVSYVMLKRKMLKSICIKANIYEAENIRSPFVLGIFTPKIYLPIGLSLQEKGYIILHEQTHIRRRDYIIKFAAYFVLCLHWFNPFAWVAFLLMGVDMEMSCDERVLKEMGDEMKRDYSLSLLSLAMERRIIGGSPLAFGEGGVKERIKNVLNFRKPSRVIITFAVILVAVLSIGFAVNRSVKTIELPTLDSVFSMEMEQRNDDTSIGLVTSNDTSSIEAVLSALSGADKMMSPTVNDYPTAYNYLIVRLNLEGQQRTFCLYTEGNRYYIEEPYIGIYRSTKIASESLYKIYTNSLTESSRTYYLENPTEKQKFERLLSVTLYNDGTAELAAPPISSYMLPKCAYSIADDELLIHAVIETDFDEGFFGVKNEAVIARFAIADDDTLVFRSATVPLFADSNARYVYTPFLPYAYETREWLDYFYDEEMPWEGSLELELPEYPDTVFRWTPYEVKAIDSDGEKILFYGMPVWNVYLADLTGDGLPEFCATVSFGSGIIDERVIVYDHAADKTYGLNDRSYYDYVLYLDSGRLMVKQTEYPDPKSDAIATGELAIVGGKLTAIGIDRTITNPIDLLLSSWLPLADLPIDYGKEQAVADSVYVNVHGMEIYNQDMVDNFYENVFAGSRAFMRVMQYTTEGDAIITDYQFDGEMFTVTHDSTRDKFMNSDDRIISTASYKYLVPLGSSYLANIAEIYYLSNEQNIFTGTEDGEEVMLIDGLWWIPSPSDSVN